MLRHRGSFRWAAIGLLGLALGVNLEATSVAKPPNIVFILADDLGYADVGCYGRQDISTPNIDQLAANGIRFRQGYANSAVCSATRLALMTGRYQYRLRAGLEEPLVGNVPVGLDPSHPTLPSLLKKAGYSSTLVGKWHLGVLPKFGPLQSGYDHFYGFRGGAVDYFTHSNGERHDLWDDDKPTQESGYLTELLGNRAVQVVNGYAKTGQPFLLSLHFSAPHWPWEGPDDEAESKRLALARGGLFHYDGGTQKTYARMVEAMDEQIGRVMQALDEHKMTENTIVVFTSDNGGERFSNTWPFSGQKTELLEGGLRVPTLVSWPARISPGRITDQVVITMDWFPTLLRAAGVVPDGHYPSDGLNLLPVLTDNAAVTSRTLFWRYKANKQRAVRDGDLKYLKIGDHRFLFNLVDDPRERANLHHRQESDYRRLERAWYAWNESMLPQLKESTSGGIDGSVMADHYGAARSDGEPDVPVLPED